MGKKKINRNIPNDYPVDKSLKAYCHYPLVLAEQEYEDSQKQIYRIMTINWTLAANETLGTVDYEHVYKNIYEMTLGEFLQWMDMEEISEAVISIEKIGNKKSSNVATTK